MDNLTHSLIGWALAETGLGARTRKGTVACILAANLPDIDVLFGWAPWPPLAMHRGFTHGLPGGVLLLPPLLAVGLWLFDRWQTARRDAAIIAPPMRFGWLLALCWLAALTHPLMDMQNVYAVQLLAPFSSRWFHTDSLFIISPWVLGLLGTGIWLARRRASPRPAVIALAATAAFILGNIGLSALAWNTPAAGNPHVRPDRVFASPEPLAFWRRDVAWRQNGRITQGRYDPLFALSTLRDQGAPEPDGMADPLVRRAAVATPQIVHFLAWSQMPTARISLQGCQARVTFGDARYANPLVRGNFQVDATLRTDTAGCTG